MQEERTSAVAQEAHIFKHSLYFPDGTGRNFGNQVLFAVDRALVKGIFQMAPKKNPDRRDRMSVPANLLAHLDQSIALGI